MLPYEGAFSFVSSRLHDNVKKVLPHYDRNDPKTWPYVTMETIEKYGPYGGYPDLPAGIAYQRSIMRRYEGMYSAEERKQSASMNGSFHERYPCNYDRHDKLKNWVGMSKTEYRRYMTTVAKGLAVDTYDHELRRPQQQSASTTTTTEGNEAPNRGCCANSRCIEVRREAFRLPGELLDKKSQLMSSQQSLREFEFIDGCRRNATSDVQFELEKQRERAAAAERECEIRRENNVKLMRRVRELERMIVDTDELEAYCSQLEVEVDVLKGKRSRDVVESDPDEDLMEGYRSSSKRMRSSSVN
jgi:hypothetical protein